jgi:hypothetical protein
MKSNCRIVLSIATVHLLFVEFCFCNLKPLSNISIFLLFVYCHIQNSVLAKVKLGPLWRVCDLKWVCCGLRHVPSLIIYVPLLCLGDILMGCIYMYWVSLLRISFWCKTWTFHRCCYTKFVLQCNSVNSCKLRHVSSALDAAVLSPDARGFLNPVGTQTHDLDGAS